MMMVASYPQGGCINHKYSFFINKSTANQTENNFFNSLFCTINDYLNPRGSEQLQSLTYTEEWTLFKKGGKKRE